MAKPKEAAPGGPLSTPALLKELSSRGLATVPPPHWLRRELTVSLVAKQNQNKDNMCKILKMKLFCSILPFDFLSSIPRRRAHCQTKLSIYFVFRFVHRLNYASRVGNSGIGTNVARFVFSFCSLDISNDMTINQCG